MLRATDHLVRPRRLAAYSTTSATACSNHPLANPTAALLLPQAGQAMEVGYVSPANERVTDGARTRDLRDHNPMLCQLSYGHQEMVFDSIIRRILWQSW